MDLMQNEERNDDFGNLLVRFWENRITDEELERFQDILASSRKRMVEFRELQRIKMLLDGKEYGRRFDAGRALERMRRRTRHRRMVAWRWACAACVSLLLGAGVIWGVWEEERGKAVSESLALESQGLEGKIFMAYDGGGELELRPGDSLKNVKELYEKAAGMAMDTDSNKQEDVACQRIYTTQGAMYSFVLEDGSKVWLNANSELEFPLKFSEELREVRLKGEAYFEVTRDTSRSFVVCSDFGEVVVLGTEFNVRACEGESSRVTLVKGSVVVRDQMNAEEKIQPGQQVVLGSRGIEDVCFVDVDEQIAWKDGCFLFRKKTLDFILTELSAWYGFEVFYQNQEVKTELFTAKFERFDNVDVILRRLEQVGNLRFERNGNVVIVLAIE